jgi:uncharacterized RDD family membrane protein YckC
MEIEQSEAPTEPDAPLSSPLDIARPKTAAAAVIESTGGFDFDPDFAGFGHRFVGFLIDSLVLTLFLVPGVAVMVIGGSGLAIALGILLGVVGIAIATRMSARSVATTGQWIGNRVTNTRVVDARNGAMLSPAYAGTRFVVRQFVSTILLLGFLPALFDSQRRTFHDLLVGSVVIRPPRARWIAGDDSTADPVT